MLGGRTSSRNASSCPLSARWISAGSDGSTCDLGPARISPLIRGVVTENAGRIDGGHHARDLHARARESCIVVCLEFLTTAITRRYPSSSDSTAAYCSGLRTSALTRQ